MVIFVPNRFQNNCNFFPLSFKGHRLDIWEAYVYACMYMLVCVCSSYIQVATDGVKGIYLEHGAGVVSLPTCLSLCY